MGGVSDNIYSRLVFESIIMRASLGLRKYFFSGVKPVTLTKGTYMEMEVDYGTESSCDN